VTIDISPAHAATLVDLYGETSPILPDASGLVRLTARSSPVYVIVHP